LSKPRADFPKAGGNYCKTCRNERNRASIKRLYGDTRHYHFRQKYGIGLVEVEEMIRAQMGLCAVCRHRPATQVDHDHVTGKVRGIVCLDCNAGMGALHDDPILLCKAADYLEARR